MEPFSFAGKTSTDTPAGAAAPEPGCLLSGRKAGARLRDEHEDLPGSQYRERRFRHLLESPVRDSRPSTRSMSARKFWTDTSAFTRSRELPRGWLSPRWRDVFIQPAGQSGVPLEATAENKFKFDHAGFRIRRRERPADHHAGQGAARVHEREVAGRTAAGRRRVHRMASPCTGHDDIGLAGHLDRRELSPLLAGPQPRRTHGEGVAHCADFQLLCDGAVAAHLLRSR